jgi:hypothetical protein
VIALALVAALAFQDTNTTLTPQIRAMVDRMPLPRPGEPSISVKFSRDTVWVGEQVELITAAWFPRQLRDRLNHAPSIRSPLLGGVWIARNQQNPVPAGTRYIGHQVYDLFVSYQVLFPLGPGRIDAPPATLNFRVPTSASYFAKEVPRSYASAAEHLIVRAVPAAASASLGGGPTALAMRITWRAPVSSIRAGAPTVVQLVLSGAGNLTLWPAPQVKWPPGLHIYPEATTESRTPDRGTIAGEKQFRYTVVADSAGVLTLPAVSYQYFDPGAVETRSIAASPLTLPVVPAASATSDRQPPLLGSDSDRPVATVVVRSFWPVLLFVAVAPWLVVLIRRRRRVLPTIASAPAGGDPEATLRAVLGTPLDAGPEHVAAALRSRGVGRDDAEQVRRWLSSAARNRYGPVPGPSPDPPAIVPTIVARLRRRAVAVTVLLIALVAARLPAQVGDGVARYAGGDYAGAARIFENDVRAHPTAVGAWRNLGEARWMAGDDPGAAAALIEALRLAPRDGAVRTAWQRDTAIPGDVRALAPSVPLSRDELLLVGLAAWLVASTAMIAGWRRSALGVGLIGVAALLVAATRIQDEHADRALVLATTTIHISPHPATNALADVATWSVVEVHRRVPNWVLIDTQLRATVGPGDRTIEGWVPASAVAGIGPLH